MQKLLVLLFATCLLAACGGDNSDSGNPSADSSETTPANNPDPAATGSGNVGTALFFSLSDAEYDSVSSLEEWKGIEEVAADFEHYTGEVLQNYTFPGVKMETTDARYVVLGDMTFDKFEQEAYGIAMFKDGKAKVVTGVMPDTEIVAEFEAFFGVQVERAR